MKRTHNNLDEMLDLVRENRPATSLFSADDLQSMIEAAYAEAPADSIAPEAPPASFTQITHTRNRTIMISIASLILTGAFLLHFGNPFADPSAQHAAGTSKKSSSLGVAKPNPGKGGSTMTGISAESPSSIATHPFLSGRKPGKDGDQIPQKEEKEKDILKDGQRLEPLVAGAVIAGMTDEELERIFDIRFPEGTTTIPSERMARKEALNTKALQVFAKYGYDTTAESFMVRSNALIALAPGSVSGQSVFAPPNPRGLIASPIAVALWNGGRRGVSVGMTMGSDEQLERVGLLMEQLDDLNNLSETEGVIPSESALNRLAALHVTRPFVDKNGKDTLIDIYIWYVPTPELVKALPERYRTPRLTALAEAKYPKPSAAKKRMRLIPGTLRFTTISSDPNEAPPAYSEEMKKYDGNSDISGIRFLDLTRQELQRIGVRHTDSGLNFVMQQEVMTADANTTATLQELGYNPGSSTANVGFLVTADTFDMDYREIPFTEFTPSSLSPVLYSCRWAKSAEMEGLQMIFNTESPLLKKLEAENRNARDADKLSDDFERRPEYSYLNKLIPVRISMEGKEVFAKTGKHYGSDVILWYVPTSEFVNALPDRYRIQLEKELKIIASVEESHLPPGEVCREMAGETALLDFCRSGSGAISYTRAWPNPAKEQVTFHYVLTEPRQVAITLHDLSGKFIQGMTEFSAQGPGQHQQSITLDRNTIKSGAYLVTIRTDKGEQGVQRIIVD